MNENDPSILRNAPDPDFKPFVAPPIVGEVGDRASDPQHESASTRANKPEPAVAMTPPPPLGEVIAGASTDNEVPPSLLGTSFAPKP
jgi:hypothetical protein